MEKPQDLIINEEIRTMERKLNEAFNDCSMPLAVKRMALVTWSNSMISQIDAVLKKLEADYISSCTVAGPEESEVEDVK